MHNPTFSGSGMNREPVRSSKRLCCSGLLSLRALLLLMMLSAMIWAPAVWSAEKQTRQEEGVLRATLENGLRVVIVRNPLSPVVTTIVNYMAGSNETSPGFPGTAHALEHMMFRGSPGLSAGQLANITAAMGGDFNADTRQHVTRYFFTVPSEDLDIALRIEAIRMRGVLSSQDLWVQERGAIDQEAAQAVSSPEYLFYTRLLKAMFRGTPYAYDALGSRTSFQKTTGAMLRQFHTSWYVPNNAILVIVGDVQPEDALARVRKFFSSIPARKLPKRTPVILKPVKPETIALKTDKPYGMVITAFRMPGYESPDYAAAQVLADVFDSRRASLYALVPEGKALDTDFGADALPKAGVGYAVAVFSPGSDVEKLRQDLQNALSSMAKGGFPADLVEAAKRRRVTDLELEKTSVTGLAMAWSRALAIEGRQSPEDLVNAVKRVSVEDVNRVAATYLSPQKSVLAVLTPEPSGEPSSGKKFGGMESFMPKDIKHVKLPPWAEGPIKRLSIPESKLQPIVSYLPNGIRLIVQPESVSNTISVYGRVVNKPELSVPAGKDGVEDVLDELFSFGTASLDRLAFLKAVDDIGAYVSAGPDFSLQVLADRFDQGVRLLADNQLNPALPSSAFETVRRQAASAAAGLLKSSEYMAERALKAALFPPDDPKLRQATPATISSLTVDDVREYYRKVYRPDLTTIVVIGKVEPEYARSVIEKYFGAWKTPQAPQPETLLPPVPLSKFSAIAVPNASRVQDKVILAETLGLNRNHPDYYALQLGNNVLGGSFYATRLYRDLREQSGLVYYVSSSFDMNQTRAVYSVEYACDPPNVNKARAIVVHNLKQLQNTLVSPEELNRAKALLLRMIPLAESGFDTISLGFLRRIELDLPLDEPTRAAHRYKDLTAEQVRDAYTQWLRPEELIQVTEGPTR